MFSSSPCLADKPHTSPTTNPTLEFAINRVINVNIPKVNMSEQFHTPPSCSILSISKLKFQSHPFVISSTNLCWNLLPGKALLKSNTWKRATTSGQSIICTVSTLCVVCEASKNPMYACQNFKSMPNVQMMSIQKNNGLCVNCLHSNHSLEQCFSKQRCQGPHCILTPQNQIQSLEYEFTSWVTNARTKCSWSANDGSAPCSGRSRAGFLVLLLLPTQLFFYGLHKSLFAIFTCELQHPELRAILSILDLPLPCRSNEPQVSSGPAHGLSCTSNHPHGVITHARKLLNSESSTSFICEHLLQSYIYVAFTNSPGLQMLVVSCNNSLINLFWTSGLPLCSSATRFFMLKWVSFQSYMWLTSSSYLSSAKLASFCLVFNGS